MRLLIILLVVVLGVVRGLQSETDALDNEKSNARNATNTVADDNVEDLMKRKQAEAIREKQMRDKIRIKEEAVKHTLRAGASEECDWKTNPISFLKGETCGSHYKVLGLKRKDAFIDKSMVKKAYRQLSLVLHPDKNPSESAETAFKVLQDAYECLSDEACKSQYDQDLQQADEKIRWQRELLKNKVLQKVTYYVEEGWYWLTLGSTHVYRYGLHVWDVAGELRVNLFDEELPVGRIVLPLLLMWKGMFLVKVYGFAFLIVRINYEIAKSRGML